MTYFTLHSHTLIFIISTKTWFPWLFHSCCVCIFCYIHTYFVLIFMPKPSCCRNTAYFHIYVHWSIPLILIRTFVRFSKLTLLLVWKRFCWSIPSFSFLSCVSIFYIFSFITHSKLCVLKNKTFKFFIQFMCNSSVTEFSKEHSKLSTSTVYHKHYCYRTFFSRFAVRLPSTITIICCYYNNS